MSHIAPRPPQHSAHCRTSSNPQAPDKRLELVSRLEGCIGGVLEATRAYKSPQTAQQNANEMFERLLASRGRMEHMPRLDWATTMMQCLNEKTRAQQNLLVRNTSLDVALKAFAAGIFEALGLAYFQEPFDKYMAALKHNVPNMDTFGNSATYNYGIPSPPREMAPNPSLMQRPNPQHLPSAVTHHSPFPGAHHQLVQRTAHGIRPVVRVAVPQHELHGMPIVQRPPAAQRRPGRPPKRQSPVKAPNPPPRKRAYTAEALRQAAGPMGPPPTPTSAHPSHSNPRQHRLCIDIWDLQQEKNPRRKQSIIRYGGKWYVFQCHHHEEVIFFKTPDGAMHHMKTRHALPNQDIDFLEMIQELGVEVMNCDVALADQNNCDAVHMWSLVGSNSGPPHVAVMQPEAPFHVQVPARAPIPTPTRSRSVSHYSPTVHSEPTPPPRARLDSPSVTFLSDDEAGEEATEQLAEVAIKQETTERKLELLSMEENLGASSRTPSCSPQSSVPVGQATADLQASQKEPILASTPPGSADTANDVINISQGPGTQQIAAAVEKKCTASADLKISTTAATESPVDAGKIPDLTPDSPESSELSEAPSLEDMETFEPQSTQDNDPMVVDGELEEGEIDESCIHVSPCSPVQSAETDASPSPAKKTKRRISAAGSAPASPVRRKKLPSTPYAAPKKRRVRKPVSRTTSQDTGPSAHDQFKIRACKKCHERFYFRSQLATHMRNEHPEVIILE